MVLKYKINWYLKKNVNRAGARVKKLVNYKAQTLIRLNVLCPTHMIILNYMILPG
jgi:hypothetical protein